MLPPSIECHVRWKTCQIGIIYEFKWESKFEKTELTSFTLKRVWFNFLSSFSCSPSISYNLLKCHVVKGSRKTSTSISWKGLTDLLIKPFIGKLGSEFIRGVWLLRTHAHTNIHTLGWTHVNCPVLHHARTSIFLSALFNRQDGSKNLHHWWNKRRPRNIPISLMFWTSMRKSTGHTYKLMLFCFPPPYIQAMGAKLRIHWPFNIRETFSVQQRTEPAASVIINCGDR